MKAPEYIAIAMPVGTPVNAHAKPSKWETRGRVRTFKALWGVQNIMTMLNPKDWGVQGERSLPCCYCSLSPGNT